MTAPMTTPAPTALPVADGAGVPAPGGLTNRRDAAGPVLGSASPAAPLEIRVHGVPAPQGSKRAFRNKHTGRIQQVESSKAVKPWREAVKHAALDVLAGADWTRADGPVDVAITFVFVRGKGHYRTGRNAHLLRDNAPAFPITGPDVDKLVRSTLDALTDAGVWRDDKLVVHIDTWKVYESPADGVAGALIAVRQVTE